MLTIKCADARSPSCVIRFLRLLRRLWLMLFALPFERAALSARSFLMRRCVGSKPSVSSPTSVGTPWHLTSLPLLPSSSGEDANFALFSYVCEQNSRVEDLAKDIQQVFWQTERCAACSPSLKPLWAVAILMTVNQHAEYGPNPVLPAAKAVISDQ